MMWNPEGQDEEKVFTDGVQPEDLARVLGGVAESDPGASQKEFRDWEDREFEGLSSEIDSENKIQVVPPKKK